MENEIGSSRKAVLSVFTPTYNRAYILPRLYQSLRSQRRNNFEWIVVDDGSTDGTKELVEGWKAEAEFGIRYFYQERGGKARAHNRAVMMAKAPYFTIIDSDDLMVSDGVDMICQHLHQFDNPAVVYLLFPCQFIDSGATGSFPATGTTLSWKQFASKYVCETSTVYKTEILKDYLYPEFEGELYVSPSYLPYQIPEQYVGYVINSPLRLIEYLPDGITMNRCAIKCGNFKGWTVVKNMDLKYASNLSSLIKTAGVYDAYAILSGKRHFISSSNNPLWALLALPAGVWYMLTVLLRKRKKQ